MKREKSCGTIPFTIINGRVHYLMIRVRGICGFPKGHVEGDETETETALRETWEETSIRPTILPRFKRTLTYTMGGGVRKTVVYFLGQYVNQTPHSNPGFEHFDYLLLPFEEAYTALSFASMKSVLVEANAHICQTVHL